MPPDFISNLYVFILAGFVGFEVIKRVSPLLHTPLMSLTNALDAIVQRRFLRPPSELPGKPVRLAILGSSTLAHLHSAVRIGGLRRGIWIETYENDYGQYLQELVDPGLA